jgi:hypothetical protein
MSETDGKSSPGGARDFDFLLGSWRVRNRRRVGWLQGSDRWTEFDATLEARPILDGLGNIDRFAAQRDGRSFEGVTLRLFDPATGRWSLYWADSWIPVLQPPVVGSFEAGRGEFYADDTFEGRPVRLRFVWSGITPVSARWEQAFSADGGASWETNWTMEFTRVG